MLPGTYKGGFTCLWDLLRHAFLLRLQQVCGFVYFLVTNFLESGEAILGLEDSLESPYVGVLSGL